MIKLGLWLGALLLMPAAAAAQDALPAVAEDDYTRLIKVIEGGIDQDAVFENTLETMGRQFAQDPNIAMLEGQHPGLIDELIEATRAPLFAYSERLRVAYRVRLAELTREHFTSAEASEIAAFYSSPVGHKLIAAASASYRPESVIAAAGSAREATAADVSEDIRRAVSAGVAALSAAELAEINRTFAGSPALAKMQAFNPRVAELRAEFENAPMTAEEEVRMKTAIEAVFERIVR